MRRVIEEDDYLSLGQQIWEGEKEKSIALKFKSNAWGKDNKFGNQDYIVSKWSHCEWEKGPGKMKPQEHKNLGGVFGKKNQLKRQMIPWSTLFL